MIFLAALLGALFNRLRGGWGLESGTDIINAVAYGIFMWFVTHNPVVAGVCAVAMWLGSAPGWGRYFGAMTTGVGNKKLEEFWLTDLPIKWLRHNPFLWGTAGTMLRGMFWGFLLVLPQLMYPGHFAWWAILLAGFIMPPCYQIPYAILKHSRFLKFGWWEWGEVLYGAFLWAIMYTVYAI